MRVSAAASSRALNSELISATLDYSPTGGGAVSFLHNSPQPDYRTEIKVAGGPQKVELKKYCPRLRRHTLHKIKRK